MFGAFVEDIGRHVYTGVYEPDHPQATPTALAPTHLIACGCSAVPNRFFRLIDDETAEVVLRSCQDRRVRAWICTGGSAGEPAEVVLPALPVGFERHVG